MARLEPDWPSRALHLFVKTLIEMRRIKVKEFIPINTTTGYSDLKRY